MKRYNIFFLVFLLFSCHPAQKKDSDEKLPFRTIEIEYAQGFSIEYYDNYTMLTISNPWQGAKEIQYRYALVNNEQVPAAIPNDAKIIQTPLRKVICLSTSHIAFIDVLGETQSIKGVSGTKFVNNKELLIKIKQNKIKDVGYENHLNYEIITSINPDLVITYGVGSEVASYNHKLNDLGIETMIIPEYLETHPLGKLEWIKFIAELYDKKEKADEYFQEVEKEYLRLVEMASSVDNQPKVLFGLPWKETWYVPGGNSFLAKMVSDAGGNYIWNESSSRESIPLDLEYVFVKANDADIWLNTGTVKHKDEVLKIDSRFKDFTPFNKGVIYNNNMRENRWNGNDYWETGTVEPHIILKDLIKIFHPELLPKHTLVYYRYIDE